MNKRRKRHKKWFDKNLQQLKKEVESLSRLLCAFPRDPFLRGNYHKMLRIYRSRCKVEYRIFKSKLVTQLDSLLDKNPAEYWKLVNQIAGKETSASPIDPNAFFTHYKELNMEQTPLSKEQEDIVTALKMLEQTPTFSQLDYRIEIQEVLQGIKSLKLGKAIGLDAISNEMIKAGQTVLSAPICRLFNLVLSTGQYPSAWTAGKILPIHKKGDFDNPSNYRGITLSSCLGKLFNWVLNA